MKKIADIISAGILPNPQEFINVNAQLKEDKWIIEVKINKGEALYYISKYDRSSKDCYLRVGTSCRSMTEDQIDKAYINSLNIPRYSLIEEESYIQDLTFNTLKNIFR